MYIREENHRDFESVYTLVQQAFKSAEHRDGDEQNLVNRLRKTAAFIPELSLVAEENNQIVGYVLFTRLKIGLTTQLALAPLAVLPQRQKQGIGKLLVQTGHQIAKQAGYHFSLVLGNPIYYQKLGYLPASQFKIGCPFDVPSSYYMAYPLIQPALSFNGEIPEYPSAFFKTNP